MSIYVSLSSFLIWVILALLMMGQIWEMITISI